jgi:hypothetical protein
MATHAEIAAAVAAYCDVLKAARGKNYTARAVTSGRMKNWWLIEERTSEGIGSFMFIGKSSGLIYWAENGRNGQRVGGGTVLDAVRDAKAVA